MSSRKRTTKSTTKTTRVCTKCGHRRRLTDFHNRSRGGLVAQCRDCINEYRRAQHTRDPGRRREANRTSGLRRFYHITPRQWDALYAAQGGVCAIGGSACRGLLMVDHRHGLVKSVGLRASVWGLLCRKHNLGLSHFADSPAELRQAIKYLKQPPARPL